jgi:hypothetical protein
MIAKLRTIIQEIQEPRHPQPILHLPDPALLHSAPDLPENRVHTSAVDVVRYRGLDAVSQLIHDAQDPRRATPVVPPPVAVTCVRPPAQYPLLHLAGAQPGDGAHVDQPKKLRDGGERTMLIVLCVPFVWHVRVTDLEDLERVGGGR